MAQTAYGAINVPSNSAFLSSEVNRSASMLREDRARTLKAMFVSTPLVLGGLTVSATGTGLQVRVATGEGTDGAGYPIYVPPTVPNTATAFDMPAEGTEPEITLAPAHATLPRIDLVYLRAATLLTDFASILTNDGTTTSAQVMPQTRMSYFILGVVQGVPGASPVAPAAANANDLVVSQVLVPAGATTLAAGNITDRRTLIGGVPRLNASNVFTGEVNTFKGQVKLEGPAPELDLAATGEEGRRFRLLSTDKLSSAGSGRLGFFDASAGAYRGVIDKIGNWGIGTTSPDARLTVAGGNIVRKGVYSINQDMGVLVDNGKLSDDPNYKAIGLKMKSDAGGVFRGAIDYLLNGSTIEAVSFLQDGKVGIGTSSPSAVAKLTVAGGAILHNDITGTNALAFNNPGSNFIVGRGYSLTGDISGFKFGYANAANNYTGEILALTAQGRVGIGTTDPIGNFHVSGGVAKSHIVLNTNTTEPALTMHRWSGTGSLYFAAQTKVGVMGPGAYMAFGLAGTAAVVGSESYTELMRLTTTGRVGIGTTDPDFPLTVIGGGAFRRTDGSKQELAINVGISQLVASGVTLAHNNESTGARVLKNLIRFWESGVAIEDGSANQRLTVLNSGNVGIGLSNPSEMLTLAAGATRKIRVDRRGAAGLDGSSMALTAGGAGVGGTNNIGGNLILDGGEATGNGTSLIIFRTAGGGSSGTAESLPTERMRLTGAGFLGIGTTNPLAPLYVATTTNTYALGIGDPTSTGTRLMLAGTAGATNRYAMLQTFENNVAGGLLVLQRNAGTVMVAKDTDDGTGAKVQVTGGISEDGVKLVDKYAGKSSGQFTATFTGYSAAVTGVVKWWKTGDIVTLELPQTGGTSNSSTWAIDRNSIPAELKPATEKSFFVRLVSGGASRVGVIITSTNPIVDWSIGAADGTDTPSSGYKGLMTCCVTYSLS
jgi:hypothetical protein